MYLRELSLLDGLYTVASWINQDYIGSTLVTELTGYMPSPYSSMYSHRPFWIMIQSFSLYSWLPLQHHIEGLGNLPILKKMLKS